MQTRPPPPSPRRSRLRWRRGTACLLLLAPRAECMCSLCSTACAALLSWPRVVIHIQPGHSPYLRLSPRATTSAEHPGNPPFASFHLLPSALHRCEMRDKQGRHSATESRRKVGMRAEERRDAFSGGSATTCQRLACDTAAVPRDAGGAGVSLGRREGVASKGAGSWGRLLL